jgi:hypothetical protein
MVSSVLAPPAVRVPYCCVHQRVWVTECRHWVSLPASSTLDEDVVTKEAVCDLCMVCVFETFRAQFPALYTSAPREPQVAGQEAVVQARGVGLVP